jgi:hypothetical protein
MRSPALNENFADARPLPGSTIDTEAIQPNRKAGFRSLGDTSPASICSSALQNSVRLVFAPLAVSQRRGAKSPTVCRADGVMDVSLQRGEHLGHFWQHRRVQILDLAGT